MKKQILLFMLTLLPLLAHAFTGEVVINGVKYFVKTGGQVAEVRGYTPECPSNLVIPASVEYEGVTCNVILISDYAFQYCYSLTSVTIPNSVTSIGKDAFYGCTSLNAVYISDIAAWCNISFRDNPLSYAHRLFLNGEEVKDLIIPNSVTRIGNDAFRGCTGLTSITIPNSVTSIGWNAFQDCISLTSITIPNSVTSIGQYAFQGCTSFTSITIGSGIEYINSQAFGNCPDLTHVYCHAVNVPSTDSNAFDRSYPQYATLHVPDESIGIYRSRSPWSYFGTIVGLYSGGGGGSNKCAKPTISYQSGKLVFNCATSGATCQYSITDTDITSGSGNEVQLTVTYNVSVYATKAGMENSDVATATLCWIDKEPTIHTDISQAIAFSASPVLIQSEGGQLTILGADDGTPVSIYTSAGIQAGSAVSKNGVAIISTSMQPGSIAIIKIGNRSVKYMVP